VEEELTETTNESTTNELGMPVLILLDKQVTGDFL
jgi:hypothetical protein